MSTNKNYNFSNWNDYKEIFNEDDDYLEELELHNNIITKKQKN